MIFPHPVKDIAMDEERVKCSFRGRRGLYEERKKKKRKKTGGGEKNNRVLNIRKHIIIPLTPLCYLSSKCYHIIATGWKELQLFDFLLHRREYSPKVNVLTDQNIHKHLIYNNIGSIFFSQKTWHILLK